MEPNGTNQNRSPATVIQCRMGCGFYGSVANDNMCSKCYKEFAKAGREEEEPDKAGLESSSSDRANGQITRPVESPPLSVRDSSESAAENLAAVCSALSEASISSFVSAAAAAAASITSPVSLTGNIQPSSRASPADCSSDYGEAAGESDPSSAKPKKNRCHTCRKRVGLTGFQCRCEGLFCSLHRYSDQHNCSFDYREHGQEDIRKNNPRVVSEKVRKI